MWGTKFLRKVSLRDDYRTEITGLGDIYEVLSCRLLMDKLRARFPEHYVATFLSRNETDTKVLRDMLRGSHFVISGFADIPPWKSGYRPLKRTSGFSSLLRVAPVAKHLLRVLASLEQYYPYALKARNAHLIWFLHSSRDPTEDRESDAKSLN
jgi:hypothetical protein